MRSYHKLKRIGKRQRPRHVVFLDCETYVHRIEGNRSIHRLRLGWALYQRWRPSRKVNTERWIRFDDPGQFWDWLDATVPHRVAIWIMSCNLAFDLTVLDVWHYMPTMGARMVFFHSSSGVKLLEVSGWGRRWVFVDTFNILPQSVKVLGSHVGREKLEVDWRSPDTELVAQYCKVDVEIIRDAVNGFFAFIEDNDLGPVSKTLAAQAFNAYRYRFMSTDIFIHADEDVSKLERAAYFGGRTEAYYIGRYDRHAVWVVDVNAMYPHVMRSNAYPVKLIGSGHSLHHRELVHKLERSAVVARVRLETDVPIYPVRGEYTTFPIGRIETTLTTPELIQAVRLGHLKKVLAWADYERAPIFDSYVKEIRRLRRKCERAKNPLYTFICKRLANTLYGKFGQKSTEWIDAGYNGSRESYIGIYYDTSTSHGVVERCFWGWTEHMGDTYEAQNSFPAIAAHVTAYARGYLWELIQAAGPSNVLYVDTDSLMVTPKGLEAIHKRIDPHKLGALKIETAYDWIEIHAAKDYESDQGIKLKGVPSSAERIAKDTYRYEQFPGFLSLLRMHFTTEYPIETIVKVLKREYLKGVIGKDGRVRPYVRSDW